MVMCVFLLYLNTQLLLCPTGSDWFMFIVSLCAVVSCFSVVPRFSLHLSDENGEVRGEPENVLLLLIVASFPGLGTLVHGTGPHKCNLSN